LNLPQIAVKKSMYIEKQFFLFLLIYSIAANRSFFSVKFSQPQNYTYIWLEYNKYSNEETSDEMFIFDDLEIDEAEENDNTQLLSVHIT
jgi:hypothetical protein